MQLWRRISTVAATIVRAFTGPVSELPTPTAAQLVSQPWGTNWCGPAVAVTLHRVLLGEDYPLEQAQRELLGTAANGNTTAEALEKWFNYRRMRAALVLVPSGAAFEAITVALRGGAYVVPLIYTHGTRTVIAGQQPPTHFLVGYAVRGGRLYFADSLERAEHGRHDWSVDERDFEDRWTVPVTRFAELTPLILVRRA